MTEQEVSKLPIYDQMAHWKKELIADMKRKGIEYPAIIKEVQPYHSLRNKQLQLIW